MADHLCRRGRRDRRAGGFREENQQDSYGCPQQLQAQAQGVQGDLRSGQASETGLMKTAKRKKLEAAGWRIGTTEEFLGLSSEEAKIVEMKLALGDSLRRYRIRRRWTQQDLA